MLVYLSNKVVYDRLQSKKFIGEQSDPASDLQVDSRAHLNFLENVPLAFTLSAIAELNGANRKVLNYAMGAFLALRVLHVVGIKAEGNSGLGRPVGYYGSQGFLAGMAAYSAYLVKGYWGF